MLKCTKLKMKTLIYNIALIAALGTQLSTWGSEVDTPVTIDSRIKTFVYSENEIFPIVLHYGYQTAIEFEKDETIQTYSVGNQFVWQFSAVGRTLFIKPLEDNIITNMTVITNKRRYYFELYSKLISGINDEELSYVVRFFYPDNANDKIKVMQKSIKTQEDNIQTIKPYNFNYEIIGADNKTLSVVFDNGVSTFFKLEGQQISDKIPVSCNGKSVKPKIIGNYLSVNMLCTRAQIDFMGKRITIKSIH